jgi:glucokinase
VFTGTPDSYPRLVGDIGGTNARFAVIESPGAAPSKIRALAGADYPTIEAAIRDYLALEKLAVPKQLAFGIANPVLGDWIKMTNHSWAFSIAELRAALGFERVLVVNDFTAMALALPALNAAELRQIGGGEALPSHAIGLLGAGTGLGVSGLIPCGDSYAPLAGEGGHVTLPASNPREAAVVELLAQRYGHASAERALSGPGLVALHDALRALENAPPRELSAAEVSQLAGDGDCPFCVEAVAMFCEFLGTVAADLAVTLGAKGGVYIGGGIVPKLGDRFAESGFRRRFEQKGRFSAYLAAIPTFVIEAPFASLIGAAEALDSPLQVGQESLAS